MKQDTFTKEQQYVIAQKRIKELKKFYKHLTFFIVVNVFLIARRIYKDFSNGDSLLEAFSDFSNYRIIYWWALFLVFHAIQVFGTSLFFSKNWEKKQMEKYMNE